MIDIKQRLKNYKQLVREIQRLEREIERLEAKATSITQSLELTGVRGSDISDRTMLIDVSIELKDCLKNKVNILNKERLELEEIIDILDDPIERNLIRYRYIYDKKWEEVSCLVNYTYRQTMRIHGKILEKLRNMS